jgi:hypothetical protein
MTLQDIDLMQIEDHEYKLRERLLPNEEPTSEELAAEFEIYKDELRAEEEARLVELARIQDIKDRWAGLADLNMTMMRLGHDQTIQNYALELTRIIEENDQIRLAELESDDAVYRLEMTAQGRIDKLNSLRDKRKPLLEEADHQINILEDDSSDTASWRVYRKALRAATDAYKKVDGSPKVSIDGLVVDSFTFPSKP